jgi:hypothetical protein
MIFAGHIASRRDARNAHKMMVGKPEGKRPLGRLRRRWVTILEGMSDNQSGKLWKWSNVAQERNQWRAVVNTVMNLWA